MPRRRAVIVSSCEPCASATSKPRPFAQPRSAREARRQRARLAERASARRGGRSPRLEAVQLEQLQRLRVVARRDLDLVAALAQESGSAAGTRARGPLAVMSIQTFTPASGSVHGGAAGGALDVALVPEREREQPPELPAQVLAAGDVLVEQPRDRRRVEEALAPQRAGESVSRANGSSSPRSQAAAGIEKPRLRPWTMLARQRAARRPCAAAPSCAARAPCAASAARARSSSTTGSRNGTRASSECAIDARSVFTSRSSTR